MPDRSRTLALGLLLLTACAPDPATTSSAVPTMSAAPSPSPVARTDAPRASATEAAEPLAWSPLEKAGPSAREDHTWTVDGDGQTAYLFGGRDGTTAFNDLWAYDLELDTWTAVDATGPPARFGHEAVWVDGIGLVVYAGQAGSTFFADLWAFDPQASAWRQLPSAGEVPVARYGTCATIGPDGRLWISHGFTSDGSRFADTRAYDFESGTWADESATDGPHPVERCLHACWWTDAGELTLYAGQTTGVTALGDLWRLADGGWTQVEGSLPPDRNLYATARLEDATLVFGGQGVDGAYLADMWLLADANADAEPIETAGSVPPARAGATLISDAARDRFVLFGGRDEAGTMADLWELRGNAAAGD